MDGFGIEDVQGAGLQIPEVQEVVAAAQVDQPTRSLGEYPIYPSVHADRRS